MQYIIFSFVLSCLSHMFQLNIKMKRIINAKHSHLHFNRISWELHRYKYEVYTRVSIIIKKNRQYVDVRYLLNSSHNSRQSYWSSIKIYLTVFIIQCECDLRLHIPPLSKISIVSDVRAQSYSHLSMCSNELTLFACHTEL